MTYQQAKLKNNKGLAALCTGAMILLSGAMTPAFAQVKLASFQAEKPPMVSPVPPPSDEAAILYGPKNQLAFSHIVRNILDGKNSHLSDQKAIQSFYAARMNEPFWMSHENLYWKAEFLIKRLQLSWTHGLNPNLYHIEKIEHYLNSADAVDKAKLELLLTDAFIRYARDLSGKRVDGDIYQLNEADWKQPEAANSFLRLLNAENGSDEIFQAIEPQGQTYNRLRQELITLVQDELRNPKQGNEDSFALNGLIRPHNSHDLIPHIRAHFEIPQDDHNARYYDDAVAAAVIDFQKRHNLNPDGVIGPKTIRLLNKGNISKINQLIANMERLRWVEPGHVNGTKSDRYVLVNIPSYQLWAVDHGQVEFEMDVIVGRKGRETQLFNTKITGVRFNPDWTVPPTIKREDIWPKVKEDPYYLVDKGISLYDGYGTNASVLDPVSIPWNDISSSELHKIRMVQSPGAHNPLGTTRVLMPNKYNIYLHDTNRKNYFDRIERALSSGCIRMKDPEKMAAFIMRSRNGWNPDRLPGLYGQTKVINMGVDSPIPVHILYYTTWIDSDGQVVYGHDIYDYDRKLIEALAAQNAFMIPGMQNHPKNNSGQNALHFVSFN